MAAGQKPELVRCQRGIDGNLAIRAFAGRIRRCDLDQVAGAGAQRSKYATDPVGVVEPLTGAGGAQRFACRKAEEIRGIFPRPAARGMRVVVPVHFARHLGAEPATIIAGIETGDLSYRRFAVAQVPPVRLDPDAKL